MLLLLHSAFMLSVVKRLLKREFEGCAINSHGNYVVDHGKSWKIHGIVFLNFCGNPVILPMYIFSIKITHKNPSIQCSPIITHLIAQGAGSALIFYILIHRLGRFSGVKIMI